MTGVFRALSAHEGDRAAYRHEFKYMIDPIQKAGLRLRLPALLGRDPHAGADGVYRIRSLYFDDLADSCLRSNENGTDPREKFRIRIYGADPAGAHLECKRKEAGMTHKTSCAVGVPLIEELLRDGRFRLPMDAPPLVRKLFALQETRGMRPVVIVEYDREPYVLPEGNVRVTLDLDLRTSPRVEDFLDREIAARPVMPPGKDLLEIKYDAFLPDAVYRAVQTDGLARTTFSKYYYCRRPGGLS